MYMLQSLVFKVVLAPLYNSFDRRLGNSSRGPLPLVQHYSQTVPADRPGRLQGGPEAIVNDVASVRCVCCGLGVADLGGDTT